MTKSRLIGIVLILISSAISIVWGSLLERQAPLAMLDFKGIYYTARCLVHGRDPYSTAQMLQVYEQEAEHKPDEPAQIRRVVAVNVYLPTVFAFTIPLALLPFGPAHVLWMMLTALCLVLAAMAVWDLTCDRAWGISLALICVWLANCEVFFTGGNAAGIVISLCVLSVWCFFRKRLALLGILFLAAGLAIKPHDVGLIWLFFLLADKDMRKRALQSLLMSFLLCLPAILWLSYVSPHWMQELRSNLVADSARGGNSTPGPESYDGREPGAVIDLQSAVSIFRNDPVFYNTLSYGICGALLLIWGLARLRYGFSIQGGWLSLAAISALAMLPFYHRQYDCKLVLLTLPALSILWSIGGPMKWIGAVVNTLAISLTSEIPLAILIVLSTGIPASVESTSGKVTALLVTRPIPVVLLLTAIFYFWAFLRYARTRVKNLASDAKEGGAIA